MLLSLRKWGEWGDSTPVPPDPTALNKRAGCLHFFTMQFCWHFHCQPIDKSTKSKEKKYRDQTRVVACSVVKAVMMDHPEEHKYIA